MTIRLHGRNALTARQFFAALLVALCLDQAACSRERTDAVRPPQRPGSTPAVEGPAISARVTETPPVTTRTEELGRALDAALRTGPTLTGITATTSDRAVLDRLYQGSGHTPLWLSEVGELHAVGKTALQRLLDAGSEGLRPEDYAAAELIGLARTVSDHQPADPASIASFDVNLSLALVHYLRHSHIGRVNPRTLGLTIDRPDEKHDYAALLIDAAARGGSFDQVVADLAPPFGQYRLAREALARYRRLQGDSLPEPPLELRAPLKPGDSTPQIALLAHRLIARGDLPNGFRADSGTARYDSTLVEAVKRFQARHGLTANGVVGKVTLEELNVPVSWRVHQLELAMERLRWIRDLPNGPFLIVNIPMFEVTGWASPAAVGAPAFRSEVIVGKALDTKTPVFVEEMQFVIFQPYWNIPPSILRNETIPAIKRDRRYLRRQNMEIVAGQGDDAKPVELSGGALQRLERGQLRIRQRPGRGNSLGPIKFMFPNNQNVYLHGTPQEELFDRTRRDFSHGCVRVENTVGLAEWVLAGKPEWGRAEIEAAMKDRSKTSRRVDLPQPLPVVLFYTTAEVEADGTVRFARDIYGYDKRLDKALHAPLSD